MDLLKKRTIEEIGTLSSDDDELGTAIVMADAFSNPSHPQHQTIIGSARGSVHLDPDVAFRSVMRITKCITKQAKDNNNK